jgi:hypothetical protein
LILFSSPVTRMAMVEVFKPAFTWCSLTLSNYWFQFLVYSLRVDLTENTASTRSSVLIRFFSLVQHYVLLKVIHFKSPSLHVSTNVGHHQVLKLLGKETAVFFCFICC